MKTKLKVTHTIGNSTFEMEIDEIMNEEEFKTAKNTLRREMKYFISDMEEKLPAIEVKENEMSAQRNTPTAKQIQTLKRHGIHQIDGIAVEYIDREIATQTIKTIFENKNIQPVYNHNSFSDDNFNFPEE